MKPEFIRIALTHADGSLGVMAFITRGLSDAAGTVFEREASDEAIDAECIKTFTNVPEPNPVVRWRRIEESDLPASREYRGAWVDPGSGPIEHDMPKAREIHRERLRAARVKRFAVLTADAEQAGRNAAKLDAIEEKRQALRDAPADPRIEAAQTIDELRQVRLP